ncbi:MAG: hypothetical protein PHD10_03740 [Bacilli bacterium]|nr:hypothetical protein [Bacilli bacterium]MDD4608222.1 hypothetical protein [Bacilli bacterium]
MDKDTKQLYKTVVKDLSLKTIVQSSPARVSFAVSNLFSGLKKFHKRNVDAMKKTASNVASTAVNIGAGAVSLGANAVHGAVNLGANAVNSTVNLGTNIANKAVDFGTTVNAGFNTLVQNNEAKREFVNEQVGSDVVQEAIDAEVDKKYSEDIQRKEEMLASIERDNRLINAGAGFIINVYQADIEKLKQKVVRQKEKPHRLLVNKMFLNQFKDSAIAKRIRLRERKKIKVAIAKEVNNFDIKCQEIREQFKDDPNMVMQKIEEEKGTLSATAKDYTTLRSGLGYGVTEKEIWNAYFADINANEIGIEPVESIVIEETPVVEEPIVTPEEVQVEEVPTEPVVEETPVVEEPVVAPEEVQVEEVPTEPVVEETPVVEEPVVAPEEVQVEEVPTEPVVEETPVVEEPVVAPEEVQVEEVQTEPMVEETPVVEEPVVAPEEVQVEEVQTEPMVEETPVVEEPVVAPEKVQVEEAQNPDALLNNIDSMRNEYRNELNDGYEYTEDQKKEWEDARLAEDLSAKEIGLSFEEQEANVLNYEQGLRKQREAIVEMEKQLAIIKEAEEKIAELTKNIDPEILNRVHGEENALETTIQNEPTQGKSK